jgi:hypothetical protein
LSWQRGALADSADLSLRRIREGLKEFRQERTKVFQAIGRSLKDDDCDGELRHVLLKGEITVDGHEGVEACLGFGQ